MGRLFVLNRTRALSNPAETRTSTALKQAGVPVDQHHALGESAGRDLCQDRSDSGHGKWSSATHIADVQSSHNGFEFSHPHEQAASYVTAGVDPGCSIRLTSGS